MITAFSLAGSAVRADVHAADGYSLYWGSAPPRGSRVATALNSAHRLIQK